MNEGLHDPQRLVFLLQPFNFALSMVPENSESKLIGPIDCGR